MAKERNVSKNGYSSSRDSVKEYDIRRSSGNKAEDSLKDSSEKASGKTKENKYSDNY